MNPFIERRSEQISNFVQGTAERARKIPGFVVLEQAIQAYNQDQGSLFAAALSYYALLSIFPFMLFILAVLSPFLESEASIRLISGVIAGYLPAGGVLLRETLRQVSQLRGPLSLLASVGFLWSASGIFNILQLALNRAFRARRSRPMWRERAVSMGMVIVGGLLFVLSFLFTTLIRIAVFYRLLPRNNNIVDVLSPASAILVSILIFGMIYRYVPYDANTHWRSILPSALLAAILWEFAKLGFAWYLTNVALLNLVYGSLGVVIAIMLWGYITAIILLMGAELAAVRSGARRREPTGKEWWAAQQKAS